MTARGAPRRAAALAALAVAVAALHLLLADRALESRLGEGAADRMPRRIEVAFVRELAPAEPPAARAQPRPRPRRAHRTQAAAPQPPASVPAPELAAAPEPSASEPMPPPAETQAVAEATAAPAASSAPAAASAPEAAASQTAPFEWPPSTRLAYTLTGYYRGPLEGQAQVEWLRDGDRYQVRLDLGIGPSFAPVITRSIVSQGVLTDRGLSPRRFDEMTKVAFSDPRRLAIVLDDDGIRLPAGQRVPRPEGVQDTASQFVQLTWLFTTQPQLLTPGTTIALPLALPRHVDTWLYDVLEREPLATPVGTVETVHVKPRREPRPGIDLTAELWIAPTLQYLPVRILIHQDRETWIDLLITQLPLQAAPGR